MTCSVFLTRRDGPVFADALLPQNQPPPHELLELCAGKLRDYVLEEGNVRDLKTCSDPERYCSTRAEPVFSALGQRLGKDMGPVGKAIKALGPAQVSTPFGAMDVSNRTATTQKAEPGNCVAPRKALAPPHLPSQGYCSLTHPSAVLGSAVSLLLSQRRGAGL